MQRYRMTYAGDPPTTILRLSHDEFLARFPRTPITISSLGSAGQKQVVSIPVGAEEVVCDANNEQITGDVWVDLGASRAYCERCWKQYLEPYCQEESKP